MNEKQPLKKTRNMADRKITQSKHEQAVSVIAATHSFKWNENAHQSIFIEVGQYKGKKLIPSKWVNNLYPAVMVYMNDKVMFYFKRETLIQLMQAIHPKDYIKTKNRAIVLSAQEAEKRCDWCVYL